MQLPEFRNEPLCHFKENQAELRQMNQAIKQVHSELGREYPLIVNGEKIHTREQFDSFNPARLNERVGIFAKATPELADRAIHAANETFESWKRTSAEHRAGLLHRTAQILRARKYELAAWEVFEVGKPWAEADADVAEAIDFCEFYAREILRLDAPPPLVPVPGEKNALTYIPLGAGVVISPWNFPLAILAGMTTAAIVAGNTVVLKPSSDSPTVGYQFYLALEEAGMPAGVVNFLPGAGSSVGDPLAAHPRTRFVAFTGSKQVGLRINEIAARPAAGQIWIKRVIAEMGGKDAIIVDDEADLEAAVEGVAISAFGFQGQKCSACSRAIVVESIYNDFLGQLKKRVESIRVGDPSEPETDMGPVINERAKKSVMEYIEIGRREGRLVAGGHSLGGPGAYIAPTVIADVPPQARIAQEEIFGPVLAVIKAANFDEALEIANNTEYGLTGSVYTRNRAKMEKAAEQFHVGNLYFNRKCTGALVGGHPFGGFNMSGTDSKAGGPDYLLLFTQAKCISEKLEA
jgi:1-pyrroline-5-carboxylate dehydrogenase